MSRFLIVLAASAIAAGASPAPGIYVTAEHTNLRITRVGEPAWEALAQPTEKQDAVFVDRQRPFQTIIGIGGALTDASAETFDRLPAERQRELLRAYFDPESGIGYTLARTSIASCDFSSDVYDYVPEGDANLRNFSIAHDLKHRVPFIRAAIAAARGRLLIFASPWSPPGWMKDNGDKLHGGSLLPKYYQAWANYYCAFIDAYAKEDIPIWGLTVQNEPMATQTWESCVYTAEQERDFVKNFLGPTLAARGLGGKRLIVWDHNRTMMYQRASVILEDPAAAKYVWGVGFHWYMEDAFDNVARVHEAFPAAHLMFTEGCFGPFDLAQVAEWHWGESYARSIIHDLNNGTEGWSDWNILVDETGGPNHVGNFCFAPVVAITQTGELRYMSSYYYIGHFSKFVRPGARRLACSATTEALQAASFENTDGTIATVVMNAGAAPSPYLLWMAGRAAQLTLAPHAIMTVVSR